MFALLEISEFAENFTKEGIDMEALTMCNEEDLKEGGLPLGPRKKLMKYLEDRKNAQVGITSILNPGRDSPMLIFLMTDTFPMKNSDSRENCDCRSW